ncbi:MAG: nicotinate-nucleotide adenylyltransferase [Anaerolineae bacterium]|nr:nicotinate-nucleotide adenylyltransferase [Anaerolineae bacterium]
MRIGVIGGTFDPIHLGHLIVAEEARTRLGLSQVVFVPAGQPPHKRAHALTSPDQRVEMVQLAIADNEAFGLSRVDVDRPGPCYTVDTIGLLQSAWGDEVEIYFLIGSDSLADLPVWYQPQRLLRLCTVVAIERPGYPPDLDRLERRLPGAAAQIVLLRAPTLDISATEIRERVRSGRSIRYLVPDGVAHYIYQRHLYRHARDS